VLLIAGDPLLHRRRAGALTLADVFGWLLYRCARLMTALALGYDRGLTTFRDHQYYSEKISQQSVRAYRAWRELLQAREKA
jgi:hypothetical protein